MQTALLNGVELYYETEGNGEPVLLVPPSWWPSATWKVGVVPALAKRYQTVIFDCRGTGQSGKPATGYTVSQFADDAIQLLESLKILRCHAIGFALGGQIVQAMAIARPDLVATLTMWQNGRTADAAVLGVVLILLSALLLLGAQAVVSRRSARLS